MVTLLDWAPGEFAAGTWDDMPCWKYRDVEVIEQFCYTDDTYRDWPGTHKNVMSWCILANGKAVGWNENVSIGWSFPMIKLKGKK